MATKPYNRTLAPIVNITKFDLYGQSIGESLKRPRFTWAIRENNPRFAVYLNNPKSAEEKGDFIHSGYSMNIFMGILKVAEDFYNKDENVGKYIAVANRYGERDEAGKETGTKIVTSLLAFGIDEDGRRWIMAADKKKKETPKVKFYLECSDYHSFLDSDGKPMSQAFVSKCIAIGYIANLRLYYMSHGGTSAPETITTVGISAPKVTSTFDDDIPF